MLWQEIAIAALFEFYPPLVFIQMAIVLSDKSVPFTRVSLVSFYIASISLTFKVELNSSVENYQNSSTEFVGFFTDGFSALGDYNISEGSSGSLGIIPSGKLYQHHFGMCIY